MPLAASIIVTVPVFCLSVHEHYQCRHAGACCTAGWHIPVEDALRTRLRTAVLIPDEAGTCRYYDAAERRCRIHRDHGEAALPVSCDQFPRVSLTDDRGTFVTLSHFCPTAAAMLFETGDLRIVRDPAGYPPARRYDGLDARGAWPPLVRERLLFSLDDYTRWETWLVQVFAVAVSPQRALAQIAHAAERLRAWTPANGAFSDWVIETGAESAPCEALPGGIYDDLTSIASAARVPWRVVPSAPPALPAPPAPPALPAGVVNRYLASKAFASWAAYQGRGVRTTVAELVITEAVLRAEAWRLANDGAPRSARELSIAAIRAADWRLVHGLDRDEFARWLGRVETR